MVNRKQFSLWQLLRAVTIAAIVACLLTPIIRDLDAVFEKPGFFITNMVLVILIQAPILFLPNFIDWLFGYKRIDRDTHE